MMVVIAPKPEVRESNCAILFLRSVSPRNPVSAKPLKVKQSALLNDIRVRCSGEAVSPRKGHGLMGMSQAPKYWLSVSSPPTATSAPQNRAQRRFDRDFCESRHSDMEEIVSAKQNTVASGIAAKPFNNSSHTPQTAGARPPVRAVRS